MKRNFSLCVNILMVFSLLTSCMTPKLWEKPEYTEKVSQFLVTEDGSNLVVIGKKYHYIFPISSTLKNVLVWPHQKKLKVDFYGFAVQGDGTISGKYSLDIPQNKTTAEDRGWLKQNGFTLEKNRWKGEFWNYRAKLEGKRYLAGKPLPAAQKFQEEYSITVRDEFSFLEKGGRIAMTPMAVTADGALVVVGVAGAVGVGYIILITGSILCIASGQKCNS